MKWYLLVNQAMGQRAVPIELTDDEYRRIAPMCEGGSTDKRSWSLQAETYLKAQGLL